MADTDLTRLIVFCQNPRCGDPVPRTHGYAKRQMIYVGRQIGGSAAYMCPYCGRKRYFTHPLFGSITEVAGDCFVACAVYHSFDAPQVHTLRKFRDQRLSNNPAGRAFVQSYYAVLGPTATKLLKLAGPRGHRAVRWLLDRLVALLERKFAP